MNNIILFTVTFALIVAVLGVSLRLLILWINKKEDEEVQKQ